MYGGSTPKGQNTDPRSGRVRQEAMMRSRGGGGPRRLALLLVAAAGAVILAAVLIFAMAAGEDDVSATSAGSGAAAGLLGCSPGEVVETLVDGQGRTPREIMQAADQTVVAVVRDEMTPNRWWGHDATEQVIMRLTKSDGEDRYEVANCPG